MLRVHDVLDSIRLAAAVLVLSARYAQIWKTSSSASGETTKALMPWDHFPPAKRLFFLEAGSRNVAGNPFTSVELSQSTGNMK
jgi:hypothetical protein